MNRDDDEVPLELILASTSAYRRSLLQRLGVPFRVVSPGIDEEEFKAGGFSPRELAETLARAKAVEVARRHPDAVVVGSDQVAVLGDLILGKPGSVEAAGAQLRTLAGRSHDLITALAVAHRGGVVRHTEVTTLAMRPLTPEEIRRYVAADRPLDCAGSYKLESMGIALFESIEGADQSAIVGLPLIALTTVLRDLGFAIP